LKPHWRAWFTLDEACAGSLNIGVVWQPLGFAHGMRLINSETVDSAVKPEPQDLLKRALNRRVLPVQIWL
jgi:hypothetical protein